MSNISAVLSYYKSMKTYSEMFAVNLVKLRTDMKLSQAELGDKLGLAQRTISNWEHGQNPNIDGLVRLADFFDISIDELVGRKII